MMNESQTGTALSGGKAVPTEASTMDHYIGSLEEQLENERVQDAEEADFEDA
jgi:hypothetical protein